ncbi:hypothetical protein B0T16DRAFT_139679 [Cercophora newfieldiana]|uniref:Uncharacterized protein n=1 Tax=Cercophora newfieldiana TaxID=92897 RepID=A0AA39Y6I1_9PEZI|nr:hypothetical protein B0T16DRAFT_139679 [Cercophora newfieldiana]
MDNRPAKAQMLLMMKPFPFTKLPTELMLQVVTAVPCRFLDEVQTLGAGSASVPPPNSIPTPAAAAQALQTLFNLCLVSRLAYDITLPTLYHEFSLGYSDIAGEHFQPRIGLRLAAFARTLIARRDLAAMVKRAFLHPKLFGLIDDEKKSEICSQAKKILNNEVFDNQHVDILILALMPNLERLVFAGCSWAPVPTAVRNVAWKHLKSLELVPYYGWSVGEAELIREYQEELSQGIVIPLMDSDDDI